MLFGFFLLSSTQGGWPVCPGSQRQQVVTASRQGKVLLGIISWRPVSLNQATDSNLLPLKGSRGSICVSADKRCLLSATLVRKVETPWERQLQQRLLLKPDALIFSVFQHLAWARALNRKKDRLTWGRPFLHPQVEEDQIREREGTLLLVPFITNREEETLKQNMRLQLSIGAFLISENDPERATRKLCLTCHDKASRHGRRPGGLIHTTSCLQPRSRKHTTNEFSS